MLPVAILVMTASLVGDTDFTFANAKGLAITILA
jgi:hypothetical protein